MSQPTQQLNPPTSHTDRLPVELLRRIFAFTADNDYDPESSLNTSLSPWILTRICRRWRSVSIGTPNLWTNVRFNTPDRYTSKRRVREHWENELSLIRLQIERSKPLHLDIYLQRSIDWTSFEYIEALSTELQALHRRWKSFVLRDTYGFGTTQTPLVIFPKLGQATLPHLEKLEIVTQDRITTNHDFFRLECPKLRCARFEQTCPATIPWGQLEELTLKEVGRWPNRDIPIALIDLCNLKKLTLQGNSSAISKTLNDGNGQTVLPRLQFLEMSSNPELLPLITAPALHTINLRLVLPAEDFDVNQFIGRSRCTILSLTVQPILDTRYLFNLLGEMPELKYLEVQFLNQVAGTGLRPATYRMSEELAVKLKERSSEGVGGPVQFKLCPRLTKLVLNGVGGHQKTNLDAILAVAEERQRVAINGEEKEGRDGGLAELLLNNAHPNVFSSDGDCAFGQRVDRLRQVGVIVGVITYL